MRQLITIHKTFEDARGEEIGPELIGFQSLWMGMIVEDL